VRAERRKSAAEWGRDSPGPEKKNNPSISASRPLRGKVLIAIERAGIRGECRLFRSAVVASSVEGMCVRALVKINMGKKMVMTCRIGGGPEGSKSKNVRVVKTWGHETSKGTRLERGSARQTRKNRESRRIGRKREGKIRGERGPRRIQAKLRSREGAKNSSSAGEGGRADPRREAQQHAPFARDPSPEVSDSAMQKKEHWAGFTTRRDIVGGGILEKNGKIREVLGRPEV